MHNPIGWSMPTRRQFPDLLLFVFILRCPRSQDLGHLLAPFFEPSSFLILSPLHELSTSITTRLFWGYTEGKFLPGGETLWQLCEISLQICHSVSPPGRNFPSV